MFGIKVGASRYGCGIRLGRWYFSMLFPSYPKYFSERNGYRKYYGALGFRCRLERKPA